MKNDFLISIIMPSYNSENTIMNSINSVLNQTYKNIELIIVDDGSTDNTVKVIKKINDKRLHVFCKKNQRTFKCEKFWN